MSLILSTMKLAQADACSQAGYISADARLSHSIMPSPAILEAAQAAPSIRFGRNEKGHVIIEGAHGAGWQIPLAVAAWSGSTAGDAKLLDQIELALNGSSTVVANGGYPAQHEQNITGMFAILRQSPRFWTSVLTEEQRAKIDLVMEATLVASAYTTSDDSYVEGARATALDGDTNLHRHWNPNFRGRSLGLYGCGSGDASQHRCKGHASGVRFP